MIPIFIITCDRLESLKTCIQSYKNCIKTPFEIVIIDFHTTYQPTLDYFKELEKEGIKIYKERKINDNERNHFTEDVFQEHGIGMRFHSPGVGKSISRPGR